MLSPLFTTVNRKWRQMNNRLRFCIIFIDYLHLNPFPRVLLRHTLISKPNEHPGIIQSNAPRNWVHYLGEGVHDLRTDGGCAAKFSERYPLLIAKTPVIPTVMMNFGGKPPTFAIFRQFLENPPIFKENLPIKRPLV